MHRIAVCIRYDDSMITDLIHLPGAIWRCRHGKPITALIGALACLWTGHLFGFEVLLVIALNLYALYD